MTDTAPAAKAAPTTSPASVKPTSSVPSGAKVSGILYYISAGFSALAGLIMIIIGMVGGALLSGIFESLVPGGAFIAAAGAAVFIIFGVLFIGFGVLDFFIGKGLLGLKKWARITALILSGLAFLAALIGLFGRDGGGNVFGLVWNGVILYFLLFDAKTKDAFR